MRSMCSAQRHVELRRLGNQLPVLSKAKLLCKIVNNMLCVLPLRLRVAWGMTAPLRENGIFDMMGSR